MVQCWCGGSEDGHCTFNLGAANDCQTLNRDGFKSIRGNLFCLRQRNGISTKINYKGVWSGIKWSTSRSSL